jgi:tetratricopeptide (TPR) repeat protein
MLYTRIARPLWAVGTLLIILSWMDVVTPRVGWWGFWISLVGAAITWFPSPPKWAFTRPPTGPRSGPLARAERLLKSKRYADAEAIYQDFLLTNPRDADGLIGLSRCRELQGDAEGAERPLRHLLEADPESIPALVALGRMALERGDYKAADRVYVRALEINRDAVEALFGLARVREQSADLGEALRLLNRVLVLAPETELAGQAQRKIAQIHASLKLF